MSKYFFDLKKATSIVLLFIFLLSSSGFSINTHYCKGKLRYVNIGFSDNCKSCCGKKKCSKNCCKNKTEIVKIKDNYLPTQIIITPATEINTFALSYTQTFNLQNTDKVSIESNPTYLYPPDIPVSLSILYRSIQI